jgi:hypothetical protein
MKRTAAFILLAVLSVAVSQPAQAQRSVTQGNVRQSPKSVKRQQKLARKQAKAQQKAIKKNAKAQRKANKKARRRKR